jgi:lipopolysaccharide assembly outer membrane protein LptD (OstA)
MPSRLHVVATGNDGAAMNFAADSIVKEDGATRYDSLIHLKGNVEIRTCCLEFRPPNPPSRYLVMTADEADYDAETGKLEARGTVRVSFQTTH